MARRPVEDPYVYPGTLTLKNKLGLTDQSTLRLAEYAFTRQRTLDAPSFPLTPDGFKATHKHLFGDIFHGPVRSAPWASPTHAIGTPSPSRT